MRLLVWSLFHWHSRNPRIRQNARYWLRTISRAMKG